MKREKRSALIVTSSRSETMPLVGHLIYSSTKKFVSYLAEGLNYEVRDKVDVMTFCPAFVETKFLKAGTADIKKDPLSRIMNHAITPDRAAEVCFRDIGIESKTHGAFAHEYAVQLMKILPKSIIDKKLMRAAMESHQKNK